MNNQSDPNATGPFERDSLINDARAFDLAEDILARMRAGENVDVAQECRESHALFERVQNLVRQGAGAEGSKKSSRQTAETIDSTEFVVTKNDIDDSPSGFDVIREIARGGMGVVYEARQLHLNRIIALKMVLNSDSNGLIRFLAEAQVIASVRHPNIVQVFESGQHRGQPYMVMEFCPGGTLADLLKAKKKLAPRATAELLVQVASGVAEAHDQGIVHRDLKPGNLLFDSKGIPKVADFGLAKRGMGLDLTQTQAVMGTPSYMSPEQARGQTKFVGPPTDVWALGVILYECLSGRKPFDGDNMIAVLEQVKSVEVEGLRISTREVPRDLSLIVHKCLSNEPRDRYPSARELALDLDNWLCGRPIDAKPVAAITRSIKWCRRNPSRATLIGVVFLSFLAIAAARVFYRQQLDEVRVASQVERLGTASPAELASLRPDLQAERAMSEPRTRDLLARARTDGVRDPRAELNAAIVLVAWDPSEIDFLLNRALVDGPEEVAAIRDALAIFSSPVRERLVPIVNDRAQPRSARLRGLAVIVSEAHEIPQTVLDELGAQLLLEDRLFLSTWIRLLEPIKQRLVGVLSSQYAANADNEIGIGAALILRAFLRDDPNRAVPLFGKGGKRQAYVLGTALRNDKSAINSLIQEWNRIETKFTITVDGVDHEDASNVDAVRRTNVGLALLAAGQTELVWKALKSSSEQQLRTNLIHAFAPAGVSPQLLLEAIKDGVAPSVRQAAYLTWGEYQFASWNSAEFDSVVELALKDYASHPDPGVHSAAEWFLRVSGQNSRLNQVATQLPNELQRGNRDWFVSSQGLTFAVMPGPLETTIGSHQSDWGQRDNSPEFGKERVHRLRIGRSFALSTKEITFDQIQDFAAKYPNANGRRYGNGWSSRSGDCPAVEVDWYDAVRYCRWLGEKERIPDDQQCYPKLAEIKPGMRIRPDYLSCTGYRLPTEAEWEFACRAGSRTHYTFGSEVDSLPFYSWCARNAKNQTQPVGRLKPNGIGLFDIHGNVFEWCDVRAATYPDADSLRTLSNDYFDSANFEPKDTCVLRGGDFAADQARHRSAHRTTVTRDFSWPASGFRVARTIATPVIDVHRIGSTGNIARFAVTGKPGEFHITSVKGGVTVSSAMAGKVPGGFEVTAPADFSGPYTIEISRIGTSDKILISDEMLATDWNVRWYKYVPIRENSFGPSAAELDKAISGPPIHQNKTSQLDYRWLEKPAIEGLPISNLGIVANTTIKLTGGQYRLAGVKQGGGFRVFLDGKELLTQGWPGTVNRPSVELTLPPGKHDIKVEAFHVAGLSHLEFQIQSLNTEHLVK